ncbi:MAG: hypothetical protein ACI9RZ_000614, partial [Sphingobacteriales bacterium]
LSIIQAAKTAVARYTMKVTAFINLRRSHIHI